MAEMRETASGGQALYIKDFPSSFRKLRTSEATEAITPRENILRLLRGETPVWMPCSLDIQGVDPWCVPDNVARGLYASDHRLTDGEKGGKDMFGLTWDYIPAAMGSMVRQGEELFDDANEWPEKVVFPEPETWDWDGAAKMLLPFVDEERLHESTIFTGFFERLISFMGMENALLAMVDEDQEDAIKALFSKLCDTYERIILCLKRSFPIDMIQLHDDWGNQRAPFFRTGTMEEMVAPYISRIAGFCHENGLLFHLHSCGQNDPNVPMMIACGVDYWSPQVSQDEGKLVRSYGRKLAIATRIVVPEGSSAEEASRMARELVEDYAPLGKVFLFRNPMNLGQEAADRFYREIHTLSKAFYSAAQ